MKIDLGPIGQAIGIIIGIVLLGAIMATGIGVLTGDAINKVPGFFCDVYYGVTHETSITPSSKMLGIPLVNKENDKLLGLFDVEYPLNCRLSPGGQVLAGQPADQPGGIDWDSDDGNTDGGNTDGGNTDGGNTDGGNTDGGNTDGGGGRSADCISALARLNALKGTTDPYPIREAANAVLNNCPVDDQGEAAAALTAAEKAIVELEAAEAQRQQLIGNWKQYQGYVGAGNVFDTAAARSLITLAGGTYRLEEIEGLWPGVLKGYAGGGEAVTITVVPPASIASEPEISYITFKTTFQTLVDFGIAKTSDGLTQGEVPEFPSDYTLGQ